MTPEKPNRELPDGYEFVVHEAGPEWEAVESISHGCRWTMEDRHACGKPTVMRLDRSHDKTQRRWYYYCADHSFGRWVENGRVLSWCVREKQPARAGEYGTGTEAT